MGDNIESERKKKSRALRYRIYTTAMRMFNESSYDGVTVKDICREAGVALGTFYSFFPSKEHIIIEYSAASETYFEDIVAELSGETAAERVRSLIELNAVVALSSSKEIHQMVLSCMVKHGTWHLFEEDRAFSQMLRALIRQGVENGEFRESIDAEMYCAQIVNGLAGLALKRGIAYERTDLETLVNGFADFTLDILSP